MNSPNFGLAFSAQRMYGSNSLTPGDDGSSSKRIYVDNVSVIVYYTTEQEATAPVIASHPDVNAIATNAYGINITYTAPNATDSIDGITPANCSPTSGSSFPISTTTVTCTKTNSSGISATPTHFDVIITDGTIPVISLNGDNPITITVGDSYIDAGAIATDEYDGNISGSIITTNNVDTSTVGSYTVTYNVSDAAGNAATTVTRTVTVAPRKITVTANNQTKVFGIADPALTYSITSGSLIGDDEFTGVLTRVVGENVGSYTIGRGNLELSSNYTLSFVDGSLSITPAPVTVTANNQTKVAGMIDPTLTYSITSGLLIGNDGFTGVLTRAVGETTGIYAINRGNLELNSNYTLSFTDGLFEITPAPIVAITINTTPTTSNNNYIPALTPEVIPGTTTSEAPVATAILGTQTDNTAKTTDDKKTDVQKSTNIFDLTFLGVHDWLWFVLIAVAGAAFWWLIVGRRRKDDEDEQN